MSKTKSSDRASVEPAAEIRGKAHQFGKRLPSLISLSYFEAAARAMSFAGAAKELHVTPAAVSHQIKALEDYIGVELFIRHSKKVSPTPAALAALPALNEGFASLVEAVERMRAYSEGAWTVTVCAEPLLATKWIVPRLHRFYAMCPEAEVRLQASLASVDTVTAGAVTENSFRRSGIDVSVRFGLGSYAGLKAKKLFSVRLVPVGSPELVGRLGAVPSKDLLSMPLLDDCTLYSGGTRFGWAEWFRQSGIVNPRPTLVRQYSNGLLGLEAALTGQGMLLGIDHIVHGEVAAGKLCRAHGHELECPYAYHVVQPASTPERPIVTKFRDWLVAEAEGSGNR